MLPACSVSQHPQIRHHWRHVSRRSALGWSSLALQPAACCILPSLTRTELACITAVCPAMRGWTSANGGCAPWMVLQGHRSRFRQHLVLVWLLSSCKSSCSCWGDRGGGGCFE